MTRVGDLDSLENEMNGLNGEVSSIATDRLKELVYRDPDIV